MDIVKKEGERQSRQSSYQGNRASQQPANKARPEGGEKGTEFNTAGKSIKTHMETQQAK